MVKFASVVAVLAAAQSAVASPLIGYYPWAPSGSAPSVSFTAPTATGTAFPTGTTYAKVKRDAAVEERGFPFLPTGTAPIFPTGTGFPTGFPTGFYAKEKRSFPFTGFPVVTGTGLPTGYFVKEKRAFPTGTYYFPTGTVTGTGFFPTATGPWEWPKL